MSGIDRRAVLAGAAALTVLPGAARAAPPRAGTLIEYRAMASAHVEPRDVSVWLPDGHATPGRRYPVVYMHDGQNLFDASRSNFGVEWGVDEHLAALARAGRARAAIVVGVRSTPRRYREYAPAGIVAELPAALRTRLETAYGGPLLSDGYLRFIVDELKPMIDRTYSTLPGRADTSIMGSSMGGLISLQALASYPAVFGGAGCLSTHWPLMPLDPARDVDTVDAIGPAVEAALGRFIARALPRAGAHRLWMDHGTLHLDRFYAPFQAVVDRAVLAKGYRRDGDFVSRAFPGTSHNERAWNDRLDLPLTFLLARQ